jgi:hypothetical protein
VDDDRASATVGYADLQESAVTCGSDEHGQAVVQVGDAERVAEGMAHVIVADAMLAGGRRNIWRMLPSYLAARMATSYLAVHCAPSRSWPRAARRNAASAMKAETLSAADSARTASQV